MKKNQIKLILALLSFVFFVIGTKAYAQITKVEIVATGLTCSMCSNAINKQLKSLSEVDSVSIDLNANSFMVYLKKDNIIKPKVFKEKVEKAGFFIGSMVLTIGFENLDIDNNLVFKKENGTFVFIDTKKQILNGYIKVRIFDKGYITKKEYKKALKDATKYPTYLLEKEDNYHLKLAK